MLLLTLAVLAGFSPLLARAPYRQGVTFTVLLAMLSAWLVRLLYGDLSAVLSSQLPWRYELAAGVSALGLLAYYRLWMRALSPRITEARLAALQARIRPHFFFNSLNAVLSLIRSDPRRAETMLENLSDLFRVAMGRKQGLSTLAREVELARGYLDIEKVRLGERLQIEWFIDRMPAKAAIPPLILQPLLENAVYHGIEPSLFPGVVQVNLFRVRDEVHIDIRNPLPKAGDDRARRIGNGMALENVRERLLLHFDAAATLTAKTVSGHYQVHIVLPYQEIVDAETITPVSGG
jgi:two-component system sensor histidine kinase AlgZ